MPTQRTNDAISFDPAGYYQRIDRRTFGKVMSAQGHFRTFLEQEAAFHVQKMREIAILYIDARIPLTRAELMTSDTVILHLSCNLAERSLIAAGCTQVLVTSGGVKEAGHSEDNVSGLTINGAPSIAETFQKLSITFSGAGESLECFALQKTVDVVVSVEPAGWTNPPSDSPLYRLKTHPTSILALTPLQGESPHLRNGVTPRHRQCTSFHRRTFNQRRGLQGEFTEFAL